MDRHRDHRHLQFQCRKKCQEIQLYMKKDRMMGMLSGMMTVILSVKRLEMSMEEVMGHLMVMMMVANLVILSE